MRYQGQGFAQQWFDLMNLYALVTSYVDEQIGRVLDALEARPDIAERTMVIVTADHGEYAGSHGLRGKGGAAYEEAIRLPLYVRDPSGKIARGGGHQSAATELERGHRSVADEFGHWRRLVAPVAAICALGAKARSDGRSEKSARPRQAVHNPRHGRGNYRGGAQDRHGRRRLLFRERAPARHRPPHAAG